jgi:D-alanyl-D-alanine carboxypeptidase (penicillin-binding protein 5/6)
MQRYVPLALFIIFSIVCLFHPTVESQGAEVPELQGKAKQQEADAQPAQKSKNTKKTQTAKENTQKKQPTDKTSTDTHKKKDRKKQQVACSVTPSKSASTDTAKKQVVAAKPSTPKKTAAAKKHSSAQKPVVASKKVGTQGPKAAVYTGSLPDIERLISSRSFMVMDARTGATLLSKSPDDPRQPASTIKIVTAMIALKSLKPDDTINVSRRAAEMPSSKIFLDPKQNYRANDLINAVLLASANDASVAIAEKIAGTEDKFANLMTLNAKMWGAQNTVCRTASGLTSEGQHSTARDMANLFRYAMQHNEFSRRMREKTICTSYGKTLLNHNKALWRVGGAVGGKTGYTVAARQTYVGQFTRDSDTIVVAIMGSETMWADLKKLVDYGFSKKKQEQIAQLGPDSTENNFRKIN